LPLPKIQLTEVNLPESLVSLSGFNDNQLTSIHIPGKVKTIGDYAFADNQLTDVVIPESVTRIGANAFANNKLTSITIPASVVEFGNNVVAGNPMAAPLSVPDHVETIIFDGFEGEISG
jgi:hypothetical protein